MFMFYVECAARQDADIVKVNKQSSDEKDNAFELSDLRRSIAQRFVRWVCLMTQAFSYFICPLKKLFVYKHMQQQHTLFK